LLLCQNNNNITRTASFINTQNDTEICILPPGGYYESLFIKKYKIENSKNWMKIEEFVSLGRYEQTVEKPFSLLETTRIIAIFSRYKNLVFSISYANRQKK